MNMAASDNQETKPAKTFGKAPWIIRIISVWLVINAIMGVWPHLTGKMDVGAFVGPAVRISIAYAMVHGAVWTRTFLLVVGLLAFCAGLVGVCCLNATADGELFKHAVTFLVAGVENLLLGLLLFVRSAREWLTDR